MRAASVLDLRFREHCMDGCRIEILERRIQEEDSAEVNEMVRTAKVAPEQLAALLRQSATTTPTPAALSAVGATFEKEVDADED